MYLNKKHTADQLVSLAGGSDKPLLVHTDVLKVGLFEKIKSADSFLSDHFEVLSVLAEKRPLLFASFNYDFCKSGLYDTQNSRSQVGAFPDFLRKQKCRRTLTPIFNFCSMGDVADPYFLPSRNVFGEDSVFSRIVKDDGEVLLYGADYIANTFIHFAEERANIGYRYLKQFKGTVINQNEGVPMEVSYRVRPKGLSAFAYDREKEKEHLIESRILKEGTIGLSTSLLFNANDYVELLTKKMKSDELVYLTPESRAEISQAKVTHGYPFRIETFES